jgi:hypothetical protein
MLVSLLGMNRRAATFALALLALTAPAIADARPDDRGGGRDRPRAERQPDDEPRQPRRQRPNRGDRPAYNSLGEGWREQQDEARRGVRQGGFRPLSQVVGELQRRNPGRQLDAGIEPGFNGQPVYRVRWATRDGRRIDYIVDARTGAVLRAEGQ